MIKALIALSFGLTAGVVIYQLVVGYWRSYAGSVWHRLLDTARGSATVLWVKIGTLLSSGFGVLIYAADFLDYPGVKEWVQSIVKPEYLPFIGLAFLIVGFIARMRTL